MSLHMHVWMQACTHTVTQALTTTAGVYLLYLLGCDIPLAPPNTATIRQQGNTVNHNKATLSIIFNMIYVSGIIFKIILKNLLLFSWEVFFKFSAICYLILKAIFPHPVHNCSMHTATQYSGQTLELCWSWSVNNDKINVFYFFTVSFPPANSAKEFTI